MEKETKMIGNYLCFKATAQVKKPKTMTSAWRNAEKDSNQTKENDAKQEDKDGESDKKVEKLVNVLISNEVKPIGLGARDTIRLEAGLCLYGQDLNEKINPVEANLKWAIAKKKIVWANWRYQRIGTMEPKHKGL